MVKIYNSSSLKSKEIKKEELLLPDVANAPILIINSLINYSKSLKSSNLKLIGKTLVNCS